MRIEGGTLDGFSKPFSPRLNVLIGGRGTGKSSVIELLRYCLGATSYTPAGQEQSNEHALGVLGDGRVTVTLTEGPQKIEVSRTAQDAAPDFSIPFDPPFVFSQTEIETIGLQAKSRLRLLDDFLELQYDRRSSDSLLTAKIRSSTAEARSLLSELDEIAEKTAELPKLQEQLSLTSRQSAAQSALHKELEGYRTALAEVTAQVAAARVRFETISRVADRLAEWSRHLDDLAERRPHIERWPAQAGPVDELAELRTKERQGSSRLGSALEEFLAINADLERRKISASAQKTGLENRARDIRQKIEEKQKGASAIDKLMGDLTQHISVLKSLVDLRKERETRLKQVVQVRSRLLDQMSKGRQVRTTQRERIAAQLNETLGPAIRLRVKPYSQYREYVGALAGALRGSGLRYTELSERIAEAFTPQEIAALAEAKDASPIAAAMQITPDRAIRICDALRSDIAGALFTTLVEDDVEIELMDGSDYKGIDFLSMGQRCTAVLPIILSHTERVIILDQPEDHLDNAFVVGTLVNAIVARSDSAQTIVATHNPNIPVLGDAGKVFHLDSDGTRCFVRSAGALESPRIVEAITTIMEGGHEAFERRAEFYMKNTHHALKH
jgi:hypothetical protein